MNPLKIIFGFVFLMYGLSVQAEALSISGTVTLANGNPGNGLLVKAFQKERGEMELGSSTTDARGHYQIRYEADPGITVVVRVYNQGGESLASSAPVRRAGTHTTANISVPLPRLKDKRIDLLKPPPTPVLNR